MNLTAASRNSFGTESLGLSLSLPFALEKTDFIVPCFAFHAVLFLERTNFRGAGSPGNTSGNSNSNKDRNTWEAKGSMIIDEKEGLIS